MFLIRHRCPGRTLSASTSPLPTMVRSRANRCGISRAANRFRRADPQPSGRLHSFEGHTSTESASRRATRTQRSRRCRVTCETSRSGSRAAEIQRRCRSRASSRTRRTRRGWKVSGTRRCRGTCRYGASRRSTRSRKRRGRNSSGASPGKRRKSCSDRARRRCSGKATDMTRYPPGSRSRSRHRVNGTRSRTAQEATRWRLSQELTEPVGGRPHSQCIQQQTCTS